MKGTHFMQPNNTGGIGGSISQTALNRGNPYQNDLIRLLPHVSDQERQLVRE
jgi:hypothetical protein